MNLSGLGMAIGNAGTGFFQGQQQAIDNQNMNAMNRLAVQDAQLNFQQKKLDADRMQQLSDYSMQKFNPAMPQQPPPQQGGNPPASPQGQDSTQPPDAKMNNLASADKPFDPLEYNTDMAKKAASIGDVTRAEQFSTNAENIRNSQAQAQQKQSAMQLASMNAQAKALSVTAQMFSGVNDQASYDRTRMQIMSDPEMPQSARQAIASLPDKYSPAIVDHMVTQGQTISQKIQNDIRERQLQERIRNDQAKQATDDIKARTAQARAEADIAHKNSQQKVGAQNKVPNAADLGAATQATKEVFGEGADINSDDFKAARMSIASRGLQIMRDNRSVNADQAFAMAAQEAKANGEIEEKTIPATYETILDKNLWEKTPASKKTTFSHKGESSGNAIDFTGQSKDQLVPGKYYNTSNGVLQWTGTGWKK